MTVETKWKIKELLINMYCALSSGLTTFVSWTDQRFPIWASDIVSWMYWFLDDHVFSRLWIYAYNGSRAEIEMAWDHSDEDWLTDFQRMIVNERILPPPNSDSIRWLFADVDGVYAPDHRREKEDKTNV